MATEPFYDFDIFRLDPVQGVLFKSRIPLPIPPLACELLRVFANSPQEVLSVATLIEDAWDDENLEINGEAVRFQIHTLRKILDDEAKHPKFIETVKKRGYRFLPKVRRTVAKTSAGELYEKARHLYHKSTSNDILRAIDYYKRVIALNQEYVADGYAGIAESYVLLGTFGHQIFPASEAMEKARAAALKAVSLDKQLAEAWSALASVAALFDWQWGDATRHFAEALRLASNPLVKPLVRSWYAICLAARGDNANARVEINRAKEDFPSSFVLAALSGRIAYLARDPETAIKECDEGIVLERHFFLNYLFKGHAQRLQGHYAAAAESFQKACELTEYNNPVCLADLGLLRGLQGQNDEARAILHELQRNAATRYLSPYLFAHIYLGLGEIDQMFDWLEKAYDERAAYLVFLATDSIYDPLRHHPQFKDLVKKVCF